MTIKTNPNIAARLHQAAGHWPQTAVIIEQLSDRSDSLTYTGLVSRVRAGAEWLTKRGVTPGDRVLICVPMSTTLYEAMLATLWVGACIVIPGPVISRATIAHACKLTGPKAAIAPALFFVYTFGLIDVHKIGARACTTRWWPLEANWKSIVKPRHKQQDVNALAIQAENLNPHISSPDDHAIITFTSGSTGKPKAAARSHRVMLAQGDAVVHSLGLKAGQVDLATMPIVTLANLQAGVTSVIPCVDVRRPGAIDAAPLLKQIEAERVTRIVASPALLERLADESLRTNQKVHRLSRIDTGGAPIFPKVLRKLATMAPNAQIHAVYGSTEAEPIAIQCWQETTPQDLDMTRSGAGLLAGKPEPSVKLRILKLTEHDAVGGMTKENLEKISQPQGAPGEIVVTGDHVLKGYLGGEGDSETKINVEGEIWHRTGDAGYLDDQGRLWLLGRHGARIISGLGTNDKTDDTPAQHTAYPLAIEAAIHDTPGVARSALVKHNNKPAIVLQLEASSALAHQAKPTTHTDDATAQIMTQVAYRLSQTPVAYIGLIDNIPLDARHNAKIDYPALSKKLTAVHMIDIHTFARGSS